MHNNLSVSKDNSKLILLVSISAFLIFVLAKGYLLITSIGLAFSLYIALDFVNQLGRAFPLKELIVLLAALQWVVGAKISYGYEQIHYKYFMYIEEEQYMTLVVPSVILLYFGLMVIKTPNLKNKLDDLITNETLNKTYVKKTANLLFILGILSLVLGKVLSVPSLAFLLFMMSLLVYVSIGYFFYLYPSKKTLLFLLTLLIAFLQALSIGMFHHFMLMGVFLFSIYVNRKTSFLRKMIIILLAILLVNVVQVVKQDYRDIIWESHSTNKIETFFTLVEQEFFVSKQDSDALNSYQNNEENQDVGKVTTRINQGWIISKIMDHVPRNHDFLGGVSVADAFSASLLPRFLFPNKTSSDDAKKVFEKVTGLTLIKGTSMGLSLVGEFYANYGIQGAWLAMFLYGAFISIVIKLLVVYTNQSPFLVLWFILIFFQVIKAETYLIKVLNHLIKASVFVIFLRILLNGLGLELFPKFKNKVN